MRQHRIRPWGPTKRPPVTTILEILERVTAPRQIDEIPCTRTGLWPENIGG